MVPDLIPRSFWTLIWVPVGRVNSPGHKLQSTPCKPHLILPAKPRRVPGKQNAPDSNCSTPARRLRSILATKIGMRHLHSASARPLGFSSPLTRTCLVHPSSLHADLITD